MKKLALVLAALLMFSSVSALAVDWNETGLPIVNEPYSFSIFLDDSGLPEDKIMFPIIEEATGITVVGMGVNIPAGRVIGDNEMIAELKEEA